MNTVPKILSSTTWGGGHAVKTNQSLNFLAQPTGLFFYYIQITHTNERKK